MRGQPIPLWNVSKCQQIFLIVGQNVKFASSRPPPDYDRHSSKAALIQLLPQGRHSLSACGNDGPGPWYGAVLGAAASLNLRGQAGTIDRGSVRAARIGKACENHTFPAKAPRIFKSVMTTPDSFFPFSDSKPSGSPLKNACS